MDTSWEAFLASCFPGYLLPEALRRAMSEDAAALFLSRLGGGPRQLSLLRASSFVARHAPSIQAFSREARRALAARPIAQNERDLHAGHGALRGRLDVPSTLRLRFRGRPAEVAWRSVRPRRDRPEDVLLKAVALRLAGVLRELPAGNAGWLGGVAPCLEALEGALATPCLRDLPDMPIHPVHEDAARASAHPAHALALSLHHALREALDDPDPVTLARVVAEGALAPLADHTRFELAVLLRLVQALSARRPGLSLQHTIVNAGRRAVATLEDEEGPRVQFHYDQAHLAPGPYDAGLRRYFGQRGRLRPDITVVVTPRDGAARAVIVEAKLSDDPDYLTQGYRDAVVYRAEYGATLRGWPRVVLVAATPIAGAPSRDDDVIVVGWDRWVPDDVAEAMLDGV